MSRPRTRKRRKTAGRGAPQAARLARNLARTGLAFSQTGAASAAVIALRTARLAQARRKSGRLADPELTRMVVEKMQAAGEAGLATWTALARWPLFWTGLWFHQVEFLTHLAAAGLAPYHRRTSANVRRLTRRR